MAAQVHFIEIFANFRQKVYIKRPFYNEKDVDGCFEFYRGI